MWLLHIYSNRTPSNAIFGLLGFEWGFNVIKRGWWTSVEVWPRLSVPNSGIYSSVVSVDQLISVPANRMLTGGRGWGWKLQTHFRVGVFSFRDTYRFVQDLWKNLNVFLHGQETDSPLLPLYEALKWKWITTGWQTCPVNPRLLSIVGFSILYWSKVDFPVFTARTTSEDILPSAHSWPEEARNRNSCFSSWSRTFELVLVEFFPTIILTVLSAASFRC